MGLFERLKKKPAEPPPPPPKPAQDSEDVSVYSHMRVEVTTKDGQMLFVAKLMYPQRHTAELHQYSEADVPLLKDCSESEALPVHIRGYHDRLRKAVYMEGFISPQPKHIWLVSHLYVARVGNDRQHQQVQRPERRGFPLPPAEHQRGRSPRRLGAAVLGGR